MRKEDRRKLKKVMRRTTDGWVAARLHEHLYGLVLPPPLPALEQVAAMSRDDWAARKIRELIFR